MTKKSMKRASADLGFIFIAYNLRRILNIVGVDKLIQLFGSFCLINRFKTLKDSYIYITTLN